MLGSFERVSLGNRQFVLEATWMRRRAYSQVNEGTLATAEALAARAVFPAAIKEGIAILWTSEE